jgi:hypothetical protein
MRRHVAGSGRAAPGVARILATLWAVGSGRRPCAGGAWWRRVGLALLCFPCSTTARSNRMNVSRRPVLGMSYRLLAAPCVANECDPSPGPEQCVVVFLVVLALLCTPCSTTACSNRTNFSRRHVLGVGYRLLAELCVASENGPSPGPEQCVFVPFCLFHPVPPPRSLQRHVQFA